jgi:hypothetical protein
MRQAIDLDQARTVSLLVQAASFIELEALDLELPCERTYSQRHRMAQINRGLANAIRAHITVLQGG